MYLLLAWFKKCLAFQVSEEVSFYYIYFAPLNAGSQENLGTKCDKIWYHKIIADYLKGL